MTLDSGTQRCAARQYASRLGTVISAALILTLTACSNGPAQPKALLLTGVASAGSALSSTIALKDSSQPAVERVTTLATDGSFQFDVTGLTPPFLLRAQLADGTQSLYAVTASQTARINPLADASVSGAAGGLDPSALYAQADPAQTRLAAENLGSISIELRGALAPLLQLYQVTDFVSDSNTVETAGMSALLSDVTVEVASSTMTVTNKRSGRPIYHGPTKSPSTGTFDPSAVPTNPTPPATTTPTTPSTTTPSTPSTTPPTTTTPSTPAPVDCTYTYAAWNACQPDNTQTRALVSSSPSGCTGTPVLTQACSYVAPAPAACTYTYSAWGACQPDNTQARTVASSSPAGCAGTPALTQACSYTAPAPSACTYTYSAWGACQSNSTQSRTVASSSPAGCAGTPALSQACTYSAPSTGLVFPPQGPMTKYSQASASEPALGAWITNTFGSLSSSYNTITTHAANAPHQYAKDQPWNTDESLAMTNDGGVYDGKTYAKLRTCPRVSEHDTWSNTDPRYVYGANINQNQWVRTDVTNCAMTVLKTYSASDVGLSSLSSTSYGEYEGNMDNADTGAVLVANGVRPFLIDPKTGAVRCVVTSGGGYGGTVSDATMSQDGSTILVNWDSHGVDAYNARDCSFARQLTSRNSHYDACVSSAGEQVIVQPLWTSGANLGMIRIADGKATTIYTDSDLRVHLSCRNLKRPGYVYVSIYNDPCDSGLTGMSAYHRIFSVRLDGSATTETYGWDHQACPSSYDASATACPSPSGDRVWFKGQWDSLSSGLHSFVSQKQ